MMIDPKGSRPGTLVKFAEVARNAVGNPVREGVEATEETAAGPPTPNFSNDLVGQPR